MYILNAREVLSLFMPCIATEYESSVTASVNGEQ